MAKVLFVSKPVAPPWNDSGKNLVKDLALGLSRHQATVMTRQGEPLEGANVGNKYVYPAATGGFAPALMDQARVFGHLLADTGHDLWHFFFAPNPKSCLAGGLSAGMRAKTTVHTVSSAPRDPASIVPKLFADVHVVLSAHTQRRLLQAGLAPDRVVRIPPAIGELPVPTGADRQAARRELGLPASAALAVYPGDLEFGEGGRACIEGLRALNRPDVMLVMACRAKTEAAREAEANLRAEAERGGLANRIVWLGETPHIHSLLGAADVVLLPSRDLYAKMDYPLVLLEAMAMERPVVVASRSAAEELCSGGGAIAVEPEGEAVAAALDGLLFDPARSAQMGAMGRAEILSTYSPQVMAAAYEALYDRLI